MHVTNVTISSFSAMVMAGVLVVAAVAPVRVDAAPKRDGLTRASKFAALNRHGNESTAELQRMAKGRPSAVSTQSEKERFNEWLDEFRMDFFAGHAGGTARLAKLAKKVVFPLVGSEGLGTAETYEGPIHDEKTFVEAFNLIFSEELRLVFYNVEARRDDANGDEYARMWRVVCAMPWADPDDGMVYESGVVFWFDGDGKGGYRLVEITLAG